MTVVGTLVLGSFLPSRQGISMTSQAYSRWSFIRFQDLSVDSTHRPRLLQASSIRGILISYWNYPTIWTKRTAMSYSITTSEKACAYPSLPPGSRTSGDSLTLSTHRQHLFQLQKGGLPTLSFEMSTTMPRNYQNIESNSSTRSFCLSSKRS
jgi:hypothetical protein